MATNQDKDAESREVEAGGDHLYPVMHPVATSIT